MKENEEINITVKIAGRPYPLTVSKKEAGLIKGTATEINIKVIDFLSSYKQKDKQDCMAMLLLMEAVELKKLKKSEEDPILLNKLSHLDAILEGVIEEK